MKKPGGLTELSSSDLERLHAVLSQDSAQATVTEATLSAAGDTCVRVAAEMIGLPRAAARFAVDAALAERRATRAAKLDLVWTGPDPRVSTARYTANAVRELFASAKKSVLVAGYSFDHGTDIFEPLHAAMRDREVSASLFLDIATNEFGEEPKRYVDNFVKNLLTKNWPFGAPFPTVYYYPPTIVNGPYASLHAKCIVVDERKALVTSANFTDRGQTRNIEVGVLIDDAAFAKQLLEQWWQAVSAGVVVKVPHA
ncbi:MAG TPA: DISARM system phospholipase D-like protein DrmC [Polyangiaceae bacterium]|nr:DISARM system phospholipase D-like protein DrmC [Polyangiaceae bacterium]